MSERGQGIRLFSSEEELTAIFEEWDPESDDEEDEEDGDARSDAGVPNTDDRKEEKDEGNGIITSHLCSYPRPPLLPLLHLPRQKLSANFTSEPTS